MEVEPCVLSASSDLGEQYIRAMTLAGEYAYAGRDWVCDRVARLLGGQVMESIHNHHNFAWREVHAGQEYWVVRKGATPAFPGQKGFVGATMSEPAVILEGVDGEESKLTLYSTIHGAGRVMGGNCYFWRVGYSVDATLRSAQGYAWADSRMLNLSHKDDFGFR
jgi:tRNA-splicing ligase RtcB